MKYILLIAFAIIFCSGFAQKDSLRPIPKNVKTFDTDSLIQKVPDIEMVSGFTISCYRIEGSSSYRCLTNFSSWKDHVNAECKKKDTAFRNKDALYILDNFPVDSLRLEQTLWKRTIKNITTIPPEKIFPCCWTPCSWTAIIETYSDKELRRQRRADKRLKKNGSVVINRLN